MYYSSKAIFFDHPHTAKPEAKAHLKDLGMDVRIILNLILTNQLRNSVLD
jgi:antitoxin component of RelBE/YafQ-DinJ toxin-antitoxin module